jgi:diguanylate cyclase (GGDEF)-like protein
VQTSPTAAAFNPADLPSPPAAVARVVRMASDPEVTAEKLGQVVASDPAFTAELLRTVNSPFYGLKQPITAAARAVTVLGNRALRNLAICFAVRDSLRNSGFRAQDLERFWEDCLRRAVVARSVARLSGTVPADEAFTIGLLQDFGMLAFLKANRQDFQHWDRWRGELPDARRDEERIRFGMSHDDLARHLGERWGLPASLVDALAWHHEPHSPGVPAASKALALVAWHGDMVAALLGGRSQAALTAAHAALARDFSLSPRQIDEPLGPIGMEIESAAAGLGMRVGKQPAFADIMAEANRTLAQMNTSYEDLTRQLERALAEKEALTSRLQATNAELERLAYFDPLTGLCNRRRFDGLLREELNRAAVSASPVTFIMVDLDRFKSVNDTYGHGIGDAVLRMAAQVLRSAVHDSDIAARLGGEEMCVVLPGTDAATGWAAAERLREAVARGSVSTPQGPLRVTASLGVATYVGNGQAIDVEALVQVLHDVSDKALYESKSGGRNRVTVGGVIR